MGACYTQVSVCPALVQGCADALFFWETLILTKYF